MSQVPIPALAPTWNWPCCHSAYRTLSLLQTTGGLRTWESPEDSEKNGQMATIGEKEQKEQKAKGTRLPSLQGEREGPTCIHYWGTLAEVTADLCIGAAVIQTLEYSIEPVTVPVAWGCWVMSMHEHNWNQTQVKCLCLTQTLKVKKKYN